MPHLKAHFAVVFVILSISNSAAATLLCVGTQGSVRTGIEINSYTSTVKIAHGSQSVSKGSFPASLDDSKEGLFKLINFIGHSAAWQIFLSPAGNYLLSGHTPASEISDDLLYERYVESLECTEVY